MIELILEIELAILGLIIIAISCYPHTQVSMEDEMGKVKSIQDKMKEMKEKMEKMKK